MQILHFLENRFLLFLVRYIIPNTTYHVDVKDVNYCIALGIRNFTPPKILAIGLLNYYLMTHTFLIYIYVFTYHSLYECGRTIDTCFFPKLSLFKL